MTYQSTLETARVDLRRSSETEAMDEEATPGEDAEFRLIVVGKSGGGKSATGNTILNHKEFEAIAEAKTTTLRCQKGQGTWKGTKISVVDTPAMFDSQSYNEIVRRQIVACMELSQPGPHALILVTQVGRFTAEDATAAKCVWDIFGAESAQYTILVFTCVEDLGRTPLQEYIQKSNNRNLQEVIWRCGNRICGFNNRAEGDEQDRQVSALMETVQRTISANGGGYYSNWLYEMRNVQDEHVKAFLAEKKTARQRAARRPWSSIKIVTVTALFFLVVAIVIAIILLVHFM